MQSEPCATTAVFVLVVHLSQRDQPYKERCPDVCKRDRRGMWWCRCSIAHGVSLENVRSPPSVGHVGLADPDVTARLTS